MGKLALMDMPVRSVLEYKHVLSCVVVSCTGGYDLFELNCFTLIKFKLADVSTL